MINDCQIVFCNEEFDKGARVKFCVLITSRKYMLALISSVQNWKHTATLVAKGTTS